MTFDVCVFGGRGHIALPLSIAFALRGKGTAVFELDRERLRRSAAAKRSWCRFKDAGTLPELGFAVVHDLEVSLASRH